MLTRDDVIIAFQMILGREPENEDVIEHHIREHDSLASLRRALFHSQESVRARFLIDDFYLATTPARYGVNANRYRERGGTSDIDDPSAYLRLGGAGDLARYYFLCMAQDLIAKDNISGNFVELGVYKGATAALLAKGARRQGRHLFLLDTFEGFSEADLVAIDSEVDKQFTDTSLDAVRVAVGSENVSFVKGYFPDTAKELPDSPYALVHIDCDLYAPIHAALTYFWPRLSPGGFMIVHDYMSLFWDGAEKAVDEFFASRAEFVIPIPDSAGTVAVRKSAGS